MADKPVLIVMLTYNDRTVGNAAEIFAQCKDSPAEYWGFKEAPLPLPQMQSLYAEMKRCGKKTALEVVAYSEEECLRGAQTAVTCGCDILMGTVFSEKICALCQEHGIKYMPFVGDVYDRPSVLSGSIDKMLSDARMYLEKGAYGIDLLGYRYTGDASALIRRFTKEIGAPVCVAGSINSYERLDEIKAVSPAAFTIGSAFFDGCFGDSFRGQIDKVCAYLKEPVPV